MTSKMVTYFLLIFLIYEGISQDQAQQIDEYIIKARQDWGIPGMAVAIVKDGKVILSRGYGVRKAGENDRVDDETLFAIASNTKAFTAAALSALVEQGTLKWKDKVIKYLPDFELYDDYVTMETTIEDLLCHRVGLGTYSGDLMWYKSELSAEQLIGKLKYVPQAFEFRDGYGYSNLMFITAGEVIKKVSGQSWNHFVDSVFLKPLHMEQTVTSTYDLSSRLNVASPHKPYVGGNQVLEWVNWDNMAAAGGIISNVKEMAQWLLMQLNHGIFENDTIISPGQQQLMWSIHNPMTLNPKERMLVPGMSYKGYGLGWKINNYRNKKVISHTGGYDGMYSKVLLVPEEDLGVVILTNSMVSVSEPLGYYIIDKLLGVEEKDWSMLLLKYHGGGVPDRIEYLKDSRVKKTKPTLPLPSYTGTYYSGMHGKVSVSINQKDMTLHFENAPKLDATLTHWHDDTWEIHWVEPQAWFGFGLVQFLLDTDRTVKKLHFDVPNYDIFFDETDLTKIE